MVTFSNWFLQLLSGREKKKKVEAIPFVSNFVMKLQLFTWEHVSLQ